MKATVTGHSPSQRLTFGFVTPSYAPDYRRCQLLCKSIDRFVTPAFTHYVVVDRADIDLFRCLASDHRIILCKQDVLPTWLWQVPVFKKKNLWVNCRALWSRRLVVRGWIVQQLIKLLANKFVQEDVIVFADSDVAFVNPFDLGRFVDKQERVRLFRVPHSKSHDDRSSNRWKNTARTLLGLAKNQQIYDFYISQIVTWRRDELELLQQHVERTTGREFVESLCELRHLAEYILYGVFVSYVRGDMAGHFDEHQQKIAHCNWSETQIHPKDVREFIDFARQEEFAAIMISAKSGAFIEEADILNV